MEELGKGTSLHFSGDPDLLSQKHEFQLVLFVFIPPKSIHSNIIRHECAIILINAPGSSNGEQ